MDLATEIAQQLLQINAIKLNPQSPFTWASGLRSPIYCDNRIALSHPEVRRKIIDGLEQASRQFAPFDAVVGVATAGIPHGALLADRLGLPFAYVRPKAKSHGRQNQIEGELAPDGRLLVVEDLISTGGSCLKAVEVLRENGNEVVGVVAIFTYGFEAAAKAFQTARCPYDTLSNYQALLPSATQSGYISAEESRALADWSSDPETWSKDFVR